MFTRFSLKMWKDKLSMERLGKLQNNGSRWIRKALLCYMSWKFLKLQNYAVEFFFIAETLLQTFFPWFVQKLPNLGQNSSTSQPATTDPLPLPKGKNRSPFPKTTVFLIDISLIILVSVHYTLNVRSPRKQLVLFPESPDLSFVSGNIRTLGKQN